MATDLPGRPGGTLTMHVLVVHEAKRLALFCGRNPEKHQ